MSSKSAAGPHLICFAKRVFRGGLALVLLLCLAVSSCSWRDKRATNDLTRFQYERPEMGVPFRIVLFAPNRAAADTAAEAAFQQIKQLNDVMSDYDPDSELSKLSRTSGRGERLRVSNDLWFVLKRAQALARRSDGAFDITVGPYVILWRQARREQKLPDPERLERARQSVGYQKMKLYPGQRVELLAPNMRLDLGGIAKGYAVDAALRVLRRRGVERALVEGGGDLAVNAPPPGKTGWRIELSPLDVTNAPAPRFALLSHAAISTSGDLYQRVEIDGQRYSHIVDPRTGIGLTDHSLVNVIARNSITADSLTKVASVLGPDKGLRIIEQTPGAAARVARKPGNNLEVRESRGFARYYEHN